MPKTIRERQSGATVQLKADLIERMYEVILDDQWNGVSTKIKIEKLPSLPVQEELELRYCKAGFRLDWQQLTPDGDNTYVYVLPRD